jgi:ribonuclease HII
MKKISEISELLKECTYEEFIYIRKELESDERAGVRNLITRCEKRFENAKKMIQEYNNRKKYEQRLLENGYNFIAGVDEVGRGPLAGPVYAAAVILNPSVDILEIRDSKKLSEVQRNRISEEIKSKCIAYSIAFATEEEIDRLNILNATKLAMKRAIDNLSVKPQHILIDALKLDQVNVPQTPIIKGDDLSISIGAASIIAKVERDRYMDSIDNKYPEYLFSKNKGYGTGDHIEAIKRIGISPVHRKTFVRNFL